MRAPGAFGIDILYLCVWEERVTQTESDKGNDWEARRANEKKHFPETWYFHLLVGQMAHALA